MEQNKKHEQDMLEQMLKYAGAQSLEALYDEYADETADDSQPSEQLDNAVMQMLADAREKEQAAQRAEKKAVGRKRVVRRLAATVALVVAIGAVGSMLVMNVEAWRVPFLNFVLEITGEGTEVRLSENDSENNQKVSDTMSRPTYVPEGFTIMNIGKDDSKNYIVYQNAEDEMFIITYSETDQTAWTKYADQDKEKVQINGMDGFVITGTEAEGTTIIWGIDEEVYTLWGDIDGDELMKIAQSM